MDAIFCEKESSLDEYMSCQLQNINSESICCSDGDNCNADANMGLRFGFKLFFRSSYGSVTVQFQSSHGPFPDRSVFKLLFEPEKVKMKSVQLVVRRPVEHFG